MARALRILGPVELVGPAGSLRLGAAKERCLLAVVALHLDESIGQDELADVVDARLAERLIAEDRRRQPRATKPHRSGEGDYKG